MNILSNPIDTANPVLSFMNHTFAHPTARDVFSRLVDTLHAISAPEVIILTGPTGVGKSTILRAAAKNILENCREQITAEPDFVPFVAVNAVPPTGASFDWKDFYVRLLSGQHEPLIDRKLYVPRQLQLIPDYSPVKTLEASVTRTLRRAVEEYLRVRQTRFLFIDEAHHIFLLGNQGKLECQFETLKSLAMETNTTIVLSGTYRLLDILDQSGQLTRRSDVINFARYNMQIDSECENFRKILRHFEKQLEPHIEAHLDASAKYFYQKSAGCVGILKDWLTHCLEYALKHNAKVIDSDFAQRFALKNRGLLNIIEEACWGESRLADVSDERLLDLLKNGVLFAREEKQKATRARKPGRRAPFRDPVGGARV